MKSFKVNTVIKTTKDPIDIIVGIDIRLNKKIALEIFKLLDMNLEPIFNNNNLNKKIETKLTPHDIIIEELHELKYEILEGLIGENIN